MQDEKTDFPPQGKKTGKSCCLLSAIAILACLLTIMTGIVCILILDLINIKNEDHSLSWYATRYKVVCQFLWYDFKDWASRKQSSGTQIISCPTDPSGIESEPETEP